MATVVVATTGNDSTGTGSLINPYLTFGKADSVIGPGDGVLVQPGTFNPGTTIATTASGTPSNRITWAANGAYGSVKIISTVNNAEGWLPQGNYTDIIGFDISGSLLKSGLSVFGHHNRLLHNSAHDCGTSLGSTAPGEGFFDYNGVTTLGTNEWAYNVALRCGALPNNFYHGFYLQGNSDLVHDNFASNCGGYGFNLSTGIQSAEVDNNLAFHNCYAGFAVNGSGGASDYNILKNNISYTNINGGINGSGFIIVNTPGTHNAWTNNCSAGNTSDYASVSSGGASITPVNPVNANPLFVNYQADGSGDYHLQASSPCIHAGLPSSISLVDFDGNPRPPILYDIGPYQYGTFIKSFSRFMAHV